MKPEADFIVVGAGVVGLAIAARIAKPGRNVYVLEKNKSFGLETSSRHSGVIHAGIYYPTNSLKARLCVTGNQALYELAEKHGICFRKTGKLIVATSVEELGDLQALFQRGQQNGTRGLRLLSKQEAKKLEPNVECFAAILSPTTGIIDSHALMKFFHSRATARGAQIVYKTKVVGVERMVGGYRVSVADSSGESSFITRVLINCAGLYSDEVAELAGIDLVGSGYRLHYCKGEYFSFTGGKGPFASRLIYPLPPPRFTGVGIHLTFDLDGRARLGPSAEYVNSIDYSVNERNQRLFYDASKRFLPAIEYKDLQPEMAGIRPKLQGPGESVRDFVIQEESARGLPGFINLIGIESPGLTASPAIAEFVSEIVAKLE